MDIQIAAIRSWLRSGSINIFGLPFSGKDTHGKELASMLGGVLLGGGDILRGSDIPTHVKEMMERGKLVPTPDYIEIVLPYFSKPEFKNRPLILSSVGRWSGEEKGVISATEKSHHPIKAVIYLQIDPLEARERWEKSEKHIRGIRADDAEHVLENRFSEFVTKTLPVIETYEELGLLIQVDGRPPKTQVRNTIIEQLYERSKVA